MLIFQRYFVFGMFFAALVGCAHEDVVLPQAAPQEKAVRSAAAVAPTVKEPVVEEMTTADFNKAVQFLVRSLAKSGVLNTKDNEKGTVLISRFADMTKKFDVNIIRRDVQAALRSTKSAAVLPLSPKKGSPVPDFTLSGRVTSRIAYVRGKQRTEYYLHLILSDAKTGVNLWESDSVVLKNKKTALKRAAAD